MRLNPEIHFLNLYSESNASFYCKLRYFLESLDLIAYEVLGPTFLKSCELCWSWLYLLINIS